MTRRELGWIVRNGDVVGVCVVRIRDDYVHVQVEHGPMRLEPGDELRTPGAKWVSVPFAATA